MVRNKRIISVLSVLFSLFGFALITAPSASAAGYGCSGSLVDNHPIRTTENVTYGNLYLYYDSSTGYNCAVAVKNSAGGAGTASKTTVSIFRCTAGASTGDACTTDASDDDSGNYSSYAGPVKVYAPNRCIRLYANIWHPTNGWIASYWGGNANLAEHC
ncbi:hypothetical protein SAMN06272765_2585 [Streptomyces sp. Ag109_G2-15]|nr:hypothetical protein SAMN06272765_2585 [Streptomyces sp. Ag109_G2-15]